MIQIPEIIYISSITYDLGLAVLFRSPSTNMCRSCTSYKPHPGKIVRMIYCKS